MEIFVLFNFDSDDPEECFDDPFFDDLYPSGFVSYVYSDFDEESSIIQNNKHRKRSLEILEFSLYQLIFEDHVQADKARYIKLKKKMRKSSKRSKAIDCKSHTRYNIAEVSLKKMACK